MGIDSITKVGDFVLEVTMDQVGHNHLLFKLHQTLKGPLLGDKGIIVVCETDDFRITQVQIHHVLHEQSTIGLKHITPEMVILVLEVRVFLLGFSHTAQW